MIFARKEKEVTKLILKHYEKVLECLKSFKEAMYDYLGDKKGYRDISYQTHIKEHEADEIRRKIQIKINEGAFLPFYRSDFVELVEMIDKIASRAKGVTQELCIENPVITEKIHDNIRLLSDISIECFTAFRNVINNLLLDKDLVADGAAKVSKFEQEADSLEWKTLKEIFSDQKLDLAQKLMLKNFVVNLSEISDMIENTADRCMLIVTKQVT